jgi:HlyD family secretion protein
MASLELVRLNYQRSQSLHNSELIAQSEHDRSLADLHQAEATVKINEANLEKSRVDLARCTIYSPIDGIVISRNVDVGQTVAASLSAPTLFFIANDLTRMQIEARVAEADIGRVEVAQDVNFTVDAFPERTFSGKVTQIRNAPTNEQYVVTYETIIEVSNRDAKLKPGMTANVSIIVTHRENILKIQNAALRFRPPKSIAVAKTGTNKTEVAEMSARSDKKAESAKPKKDKKDKQKSERTACVLRDGALHPVKLKLGITDGRETELLEGLQEGDTVVVDMSTPKESPTLASRMLAIFK